MSELHALNDLQLLTRLNIRYGFSQAALDELDRRLFRGRLHADKVAELEARVAELLALVPPDRLPPPAEPPRPVYLKRRND